MPCFFTVSNLLACVKDTKYNFKRTNQYKYINSFPLLEAASRAAHISLENCYRIVKQTEKKKKKSIGKLKQVNCGYNVDLEVFFWNTLQIHMGLL